MMISKPHWPFLFFISRKKQEKKKTQPKIGEFWIKGAKNECKRQRPWRENSFSNTYMNIWIWFFTYTTHVAVSHRMFWQIFLSFAWLTFLVSSINPHHRSLLFQILRQHRSDVISNRCCFSLSFFLLLFFLFFGSLNPNVVLISYDGYECSLFVLLFFE